MKVADTEGDFLNLEYAANDTMYVPVERINLVQRYVGGADNQQPKLDKLGSGAWEKVKRRTKAQVLAMASELLDIYAAREVMEGHRVPASGARLRGVRRALRVRGDARPAGRDRRSDCATCAAPSRWIA